MFDAPDAYFVFSRGPVQAKCLSVCLSVRRARDASAETASLGGNNG